MFLEFSLFPYAYQDSRPSHEQRMPRVVYSGTYARRDKQKQQMKLRIRVWEIVLALVCTPVKCKVFCVK